MRSELSADREIPHLSEKSLELGDDSVLHLCIGHTREEPSRLFDTLRSEISVKKDRSYDQRAGFAAIATPSEENIPSRAADEGVNERLMLLLQVELVEKWP